MFQIKFYITKEKLNRLYNVEKLTTYQIAERFGCCQATVCKRLHKFNIKLRKPQELWSNVPSKTKLIDLYLNKRLSTWEIEKRYTYNRGTVHRKLKEYGIKTRNRAESHVIYSRKSFNGDLKEKAYLLGFSIGDLRVRKQYPNSETIKVDCGSTRCEQVDLFKQLFSQYGHVWTSKPNSEKTQFEVGLDTSFNFLLNKNTDWVFNDRSSFIPFLAGFTDAEGSFFISNEKGVYSLANYDKQLLAQIRNALENMGIICSNLNVSKRKGLTTFDIYKFNQDYWLFTINRKDSLLRFINLLKPYIKHRQRLNDMIKVEQNIIERNIRYGG